MIRLLIVEDEPRMVEALGELLRREGYEVCVCTDGQQGMIAIVDRDYDAAILDVMLPGASGFEIAAAARQAGRSLPILMLTARDAVEDKVIGLDSGADDYLTKPFDARELLARVRAMTRRVSPANAGKRYGDIVLTMDGFDLLCPHTGQSVRLTPKEAKLLDALRRHETATHQVLHRALRYPLGILHIALAAGKLLDEVRIDKLQVEVGLQHAPDGYPIHGRALHRHLGHAMRLHQTTHVTQLKS